MRITLEIQNKIKASTLPQKRFFVLGADRALTLLNPKSAVRRSRIELSVAFVSPREIRRLNKQWRKKDAPTDVLSFPHFSPIRAASSATLGKIMPVRDQDGVIRLGEILIAPQIVKKEAAQFDHAAPEHLIFLFVHGLLHLLGYDHERSKSDDILMQKIQASVLKGINI
ncbi:MAG: rRNA maturation RNase YbeY [bacterium]|nr:rRNA maturation RNase YbeY [bacterium]